MHRVAWTVVLCSREVRSEPAFAGRRSDTTLGYEMGRSSEGAEPFSPVKKAESGFTEAVQFLISTCSRYFHDVCVFERIGDVFARRF